MPQSNSWGHTQGVCKLIWPCEALVRHPERGRYSFQILAPKPYRHHIDAWSVPAFSAAFSFFSCSRWHPRVHASIDWESPQNVPSEAPPTLGMHPCLLDVLCRHGALGIGAFAFVTTPPTVIADCDAGLHLHACCGRGRGGRSGGCGRGRGGCSGSVTAGRAGIFIAGFAIIISIFLEICVRRRVGVWHFVRVLMWRPGQDEVAKTAPRRRRRRRRGGRGGGRRRRRRRGGGGGRGGHDLLPWLPHRYSTAEHPPPILASTLATRAPHDGYYNGCGLASLGQKKEGCLWRGIGCPVAVGRS